MGGGLESSLKKLGFILSASPLPLPYSHLPGSYLFSVKAVCRSLSALGLSLPIYRARGGLCPDF